MILDFNFGQYFIHSIDSTYFISLAFKKLYFNYTLYKIQLECLVTMHIHNMTCNM